MTAAHRELQKEMGWQVEVVGLGATVIRKDDWERDQGGARKRSSLELRRAARIVIEWLAFGVLNEAAKELRERNR